MPQTISSLEGYTRKIREVQPAPDEVLLYRGHSQLKFKLLAVYQVAPVSAVTYIAPVKSIEPWKDSGKVVLYFSEHAKPIGPIPLVKGGRMRALQNLRYTTYERLLKAKNLDEVFVASPLAGAAAVTESR